MGMTDFRCTMCRAEGHFTSTGAAAAAGWDWFKGYAPQRLEFCPRCHHTREHDELYRRSRDPAQFWDIRR